MLPPLPLGEATGVVVREVFMMFSGGLGEEVGLASGAASEVGAAESEIVTMPPPSHNELKGGKKLSNVEQFLSMSNVEHGYSLPCIARGC